MGTTIMVHVALPAASSLDLDIDASNPLNERI